MLHEVCALLKKADIHIITKTYTDIVSYCTSLFCVATLPKVVFRSKTVSRVQSKINYTESHDGIVSSYLQVLFKMSHSYKSVINYIIIITNEV